MCVSECVRVGAHACALERAGSGTGGRARVRPTHV